MSYQEDLILSIYGRGEPGLAMADPLPTGPDRDKPVQAPGKDGVPSSPYLPGKSPIPSRPDLAMDFKDTGLGDGGFISTDKPHIYINRGAEAYILMPDGDFRFDGMYDPKRHGNAFPGLGLVQRNNDTKMAKLPHTPPTEKMVVGNKLENSPLRFRTDDQREQYMLDYSKNFRYDGT